MTGVDNTGCTTLQTQTSLTYQGLYAVHWSDGTGTPGIYSWQAPAGQGGGKTIVVYGHALYWGYDGYGCG